MKNKILKITGIASLVLITFVLAAPYLFKGKIIYLVKAGINKNLRAHVNFSDVDISWFRHFPKISMGLENLQVTCIGEFEGDTLITAKQLDMVCGPASFISGDSIKVYSITLNEPRLHALVHKDGHCNWDILQSDTISLSNPEPSARPFKSEMQRYAIHNGYIDYQDECRDIHVDIANLEHEGRGNFNSSLFTLRTKTTADAISFDYRGAIPYRITAKTGIDMAFRVENKSHTYSFKTDQISFNDLKLHAEGFFQWINDSSYNINIKFNAPSKEFKDILSMLPSVYQNDFASIKSSGKLILNGFLKGKYDEKHAPAYQVNLDVENGFFQYPDFPTPVKDINLRLHINNPDGMADHTILNISQGHAEINNDTLDFHLLIKNLKTKPFIDAAFVGKLDLANISKLIKSGPGTRLKGMLNADIYARGNVPDSERLKKDQFQAGGNFDLRDFLYVSKTCPGGITLDDLILTFNPRNVLMNELKGEYLSTHVNATGTFNNLFAYALKNKPLNASFHVKADELNLRDWMNSGKDSNATTQHAERIAPFAVPANICFIIDAQADKLHYDNLDMQNLSCNLVISDQTVQFNHVKADALEGAMVINGTYSTKENKEKPVIALVYDVKGVDAQKTFFAFNTVQKLMPVGKFISGKLNSQMSIDGRLGDDMAPDLQSLNGEGNIVLIDGSLKDFGPLDKLSQSLDVAELKDIPLSDIKAGFSFGSSKLTVAPFTVHAKDIDMEIAGDHGFDQSLDYTINLKIPRSQLGNKGSVFVKNVVTQAADKGIPVILKDLVSMNVKIGGTINSPDVKADMNEAVDNATTDLKNEVTDFVNAKLDSAKQQLHHPSASGNKQLYIRASYKSKNHVKAKKISTAVRKKVVRPKPKRKHKNTGRKYLTTQKKEKNTANNSGK